MTIKVFLFEKIHDHDLTKGVFPSTHVAPSSSGALLGTHWFQVYTATPVSE